jgi:hypothetical protein
MCDQSRSQRQVGPSGGVIVADRVRSPAAAGRCGQRRDRGLAAVPATGAGRVDDTFCVVTNEDRYGYFEVRDRDITEEGDLRGLTVTFMVWSNDL